MLGIPMSVEIVSRLVYFHLHDWHCFVRTVSSGALNVSVVRILPAPQLGQFIWYLALGFVQGLNALGGSVRTSRRL